MVKKTLQTIAAATLLSAGLNGNASAIPITTEVYDNAGETYLFAWETPTNADWFRINSNILFSDAGKITDYIVPNSGYSCQNFNDGGFADILCEASPGNQTNSGLGGLSYDLGAFDFAAGTTTEDVKNLYGLDLVDVDFGIQGGITQTGQANMIDIYKDQVHAVPVPASAYLFGSGLAAWGLLGRRNKKAVSSKK